MLFSFYFINDDFQRICQQQGDNNNNNNKIRKNNRHN